MNGLSARVGNDVVDLRNPRVRGREQDERFLARIFAASERAVIRGSSDPIVDLWGMWAAKEAAFKITSKGRAVPPPFEHARFEVSWGDPKRAACPYGRVVRAGLVRYPEGPDTRVEIAVGDGWLAALAHMDGDPVERISGALFDLGTPMSAWAHDEGALRARLSVREADAAHSHPSAAVRVGARGALARAWGVDEARLEIVCDPGPTGRRPPRVHLDGTPSKADVSLSHDGPWIAWAIAVP